MVSGRPSAVEDERITGPQKEGGEVVFRAQGQHPQHSEEARKLGVLQFRD